MEDKLFEMLMQEDDITWQAMIYELVRKEGWDPWDIDVSALAQRFLDMLKKLKEMNLRISGKMVLAAAILLKLKSTRLVGEDLDEFDRIISSSETTEDEFYDELEAAAAKEQEHDPENFQLVPKTPQPRKRKVSVYDLMDALQKAIEVKRRRVIDSIPAAPEVSAPKKHVNISEMIQNVYNQIAIYFKDQKGSRLYFSQLIPSESREDKVRTFIPLLHLTHQRRINLDQDAHFSDIEIFVRTPEKAQ
ncbi:MAG: segregation/condensation protein A [Nanoarchaeota archaeon]|nr:segregation/condensation protein A [Nanoarchaeota archaeon]